MKKFTNKKFMQKLIIAIVSVIMLNFCITPPVQASFGGTLMSMMVDFSTAIADVVGALVQFGVTGKWHNAVDGKGTGQVVTQSATGEIEAATGDDRNSYWVSNDNDFEYPVLQVSPELIFANQIELLDANFITGSSSEKFLVELEDDAPLEMLRKIIASWYVTLRTIAVVGLLSVLIYIGIRIIISSTSADKAKYKQRLMDWVIAFCLLFFMHYIMAATLTVVGKVNDVLSGMTGLDGGLELNPKYGLIQYTGKRGEDIGEATETSGILTVNEGTSEEDVKKMAIQKGVEAGGTYIEGSDSDWKNFQTEHSTEMAGLTPIRTTIEKSECSFRFKKEDGSEFQVILMREKKFRDGSSMGTINTEGSTSYTFRMTNIEGGSSSEEKLFDIDVTHNDYGYVSAEPTKVLYFVNYARMYLNYKYTDENLPMAIAYLIIYIALIVFTAMFAIRYIKRVIYVAFLTLMAPMVALTYPLDKIKDRKSTGMEYVV